MRETIDAGDTVLAARSYLGFAGGDPLGRRVVVEEFTDPVAEDQVGKGLGRVATSHFDEVGRSRFTEVALGDDYTKGNLIVGSRIYDQLGRVKFEADAYPASQASATAYGTTQYFDQDGSLWVEIRGSGLQPFTTASSATAEVFPSQYRHTFANHLETTTSQEADALTSGSLQFGVVRQASSTAIGRVLSRSTSQNGNRIEHETFAYELLGHQTALTRFQDALNGNNPVTSSWKFDSLGQVLELDEPTSAPQYRSYSDWGELSAVTWNPLSPEPKHSIVNGYDALSRLTFSEEQNDGTTDPATYNKYSYDVAGTSPIVTPTNVVGRLASASSPTGSVVFSYDGYGNVNGRSYTDVDNVSYVEQQGFHADGSQASVTLQLPDNAYQPERLDYAYDTAGRMRWMWFSDGVNTQELYAAKDLDSWGRVRDSWLGNTEYRATYNDLGRRLPKNVKVTSTVGSRSIDFTGFDALSREVSRVEDSPSFPNRSTTSYDALGRVQTVIRLKGTGTLAKWDFGYDALGNVTTLHDPVSSSNVALSYLTTDRDRICGIAYVGSPTSCNVIHDSFGSITYEPTRAGYNKLAYFNSGDVRSISNQAKATATFAYDPFGELQELTIAGPTGNRHDRNFGAFVTQRTQKSASASTSYVARRFPGPGLSLSRRGPKGNWVYEYSEPSGTRFTTDEKGNFLQDLRYTPFGAATSTGVPAGTDTFTTDQWNDGDALDGFGLVKVGKRIYDPALGRFLSRDALLTPRTSATTNPYAFAMNDPVNLSDPSGLDPCAGNPLCISSSYNGSDPNSGNVASAVAMGIWAANYLFSTGQEPPMSGGSKEAIAAYSAAFDLHSTTLQLASRYGQGDSGGVLGAAGDFAKGFAGGVYDAGAGLVHMGMHPIDTVEGIGHAIRHPIETGKAIGRSIKGTADAIMSGDMHALGHAVGGIAAAFGPGAAAKVLGELGTVDAVVATEISEDASAVGDTLYHYTSESGRTGILESGEIRASQGAVHARHGSGQYFTDIAPEAVGGATRATSAGRMSLAQLSQKLFRIPWNVRNISHFLEVDVTGLGAEFVAPNIYLNRVA